MGMHDIFMKVVKDKLKISIVMMFFILFLNVVTIRANAAGRIGLYYNTTYNSYDVTGDGIVDELILKTEDSNGDDENGYNECDTFIVYVNGQEALTVKGYYFYADNYDKSCELLQMDNGKVFLYVHLSSDNDDGPIWIYEYKSGRMQMVADILKDFKSVGYHVYADVKSVSKNTIKVKMNIMSYAIAGFNFDVTYKYVNGKLKLTSKTYKIASYNTYPKKDKPFYLTSLKKITLYKDKAMKKKGVKLAKGTKIKFTKCYVSGNMVSFYGKTKSGKKGWFKSIKKTYQTFKESQYAG